MSADVAAVGASNERAYRDRAAKLLSDDPQLADLVSMFATAMPSTNADGEKVQKFAAAAAILDSRSVWIARRGGDVAAGVAAFERAHGAKWLPRRQGFEDLWDAGRTFVYGAANPQPDHIGILSYGPFCFIVDSSRLSARNCAVFPGNTAVLYGREAGPPDGAAAYADAGCWAFVDHMGVAVFGEDAVGVDSALWAELVCHADEVAGDSFLEVVTPGPISLAEVTEIRVSAAYRAQLNGWITLERRGALTEEAQRNAVAGWRVIKRWVNTTHPHIELRIV